MTTPKGPTYHLVVRACGPSLIAAWCDARLYQVGRTTPCPSCGEVHRFWMVEIPDAAFECVFETEEETNAWLARYTSEPIPQGKASP